MRLRSAAPTRGRCSRSSERAAVLRAAVGTRAAAPRSGHPDERYELAPFQLIEEHFNPMPARVGLQDIELARISQEVTERFYNLFSIRCPNRGPNEKVSQRAFLDSCTPESGSRCLRRSALTPDSDEVRHLL